MPSQGVTFSQFSQLYFLLCTLDKCCFQQTPCRKCSGGANNNKLPILEKMLQWVLVSIYKPRWKIRDLIWSSLVLIGWNNSDRNCFIMTASINIWSIQVDLVCQYHYLCLHSEPELWKQAWLNPFSRSRPSDTYPSMLFCQPLQPPAPSVHLCQYHGAFRCLAHCHNCCIHNPFLPYISSFCLGFQSWKECECVLSLQHKHPSVTEGWDKTCRS